MRWPWNTFLTAQRFLACAAAALAMVALAVGLLVAGSGRAWAAPQPSVPGTSVASPGLVLQGDVKSRVEGMQAQAAGVQQEIDRLDNELEGLTERYNQLTVQLDRTNKDLVELRSRLRAAQTLLEYRRERLNERVTATYKAGKDNLLEILLLTENLNDFLSRLLLISKITSSDHRLVDSYKVVTGDMSQVGHQIETKKRDAMRLERDIARQQATIEGKLADRKAALTNVNAQVAQLIEQERQRQEQERLRLQAELQAKLQMQQQLVATSNNGLIPSNNGPLPSNTDPVLQQVVETAAAYLGVPYLWGGEHPRTGLDCSGLVMYVFRQHGVDLPHYSGDQAQLGLEVTLDTIRAGDLVFFGNTVSHVALYIGDGKIIEAPHTGSVVKVTPLSSKSTPTHVRRYPLQARQGPPIWD